MGNSFMRRNQLKFPQQVHIIDLDKHVILKLNYDGIYGCVYVPNWNVQPHRAWSKFISQNWSTLLPGWEMKIGMAIHD